MKKLTKKKLAQLRETWRRKFNKEYDRLLNERNITTLGNKQNWVDNRVDALETIYKKYGMETGRLIQQRYTRNVRLREERMDAIHTELDSVTGLTTFARDDYNMRRIGNAQYQDYLRLTGKWHQRGIENAFKALRTIAQKEGNLLDIDYNEDRIKQYLQTKMAVNEFEFFTWVNNEYYSEDDNYYDEKVQFANKLFRTDFDVEELNELYESVFNR